MPALPPERPVETGDFRPRTAPRAAGPRLLVSVRDAAEAAIALAAGVDLLDVKDPTRGSLGRPDAAVLRSVLNVCRRWGGTTPVSAALGELRDFRCDFANTSDVLSTEHLGCSAAAGVLSESLPIEALTYVKLGLAGMAEVPDWPRRWRQVREQVRHLSRTKPQWVAVAYADAVAATAPPPEAVIDAASEAGFAGVLFDTWCKQSPGLLDCLTLARLRQLAERVRRAGLFCAAAGKLRLSDVETLRDQPLDVLAVRSAACVGEDRVARLCGERLRALQIALDQIPGERRTSAR